jgi:GT2 family glycosyltransferase
MIVAVVLNYNDYETTLKFVNLIKKYKTIDKIVIVDNHSTDRSYQVFSCINDSKVDVIRTIKNCGYAAGNNYGIKYAELNYKPKQIIISNPDIFVNEITIINLSKILEENSTVAIVTGLIHNAKAEIVSNFGWTLPKYKDVLIGTNYVFSWVYKKIFKKSRFKDKSELISNHLYVDVVPGCFFIANFQRFKEINFFDETTFLFNEENIIGYKLKQKNYNTIIATNEKIIHFESVSINKNIKSYFKKSRLLEKSMVVYLKKYLNVGFFRIWIFYLLNRFGTLINACLRFIKNRKS